MRRSIAISVPTSGFSRYEDRVAFEKYFVGCAGWSIGTAHADKFPEGESHLERWAKVFNAAEINSSFYRPHRRKTYERWAASVPEGFRFSAKIPKRITHELRLVNAESAFGEFLDECSGLGEKLAVLLVQLPPSFRYDEKVVGAFLTSVKRHCPVPLAVEPRHATWFTGEADRFLAALDVSRVAADPALVDIAAIPGGSRRLGYHRWHGSPNIYYSKYEEAALAGRIEILRRDPAAEVWCILDNTAAGFAVPNALTVRAEVSACIA